MEKRSVLRRLVKIIWKLYWSSRGKKVWCVP